MARAQTEKVHPYKRLFNAACRTLGDHALRVRYWDGTTRRFGHGQPRVTLVLKTPAIVPRLLVDPELAFGEAYQRGELEIEGAMADLFPILFDNSSPMPRWMETAWHGAALFSRLRPLSQGQNQRDIAHHYDLGNDFYNLWLDATMTYSCAYFQSPADSLETAQRQKIAHIGRKLQLHRGQTLLDVGCGWGGLLSETVREYGVEGLGITLSEEQKKWFDEHTSPKLRDHARVELQHYHDLAQTGAKFDRVVSVGMAEHVGRHNLPTYIADVKRLLKPHGLGVLHLITGIHEEPTSEWLVRYIFPGGYIPSLAEIMVQMAKRDLVVYDVENLGQHYALTLDKWSEGYERNIEWVRAKYGEEFVRMWRLYLEFSAASFRLEDIYLHQIVFSNGKAKDYPLTREWMYRQEA